MKPLPLATAGSVTAFVAVVASSCCALPLALVLAGAGTSAIGFLAPLHAVRPFILAMTAAMLLASGVLALRRKATGAYPALGLGAALLVVALTWQFWDTAFRRLIMAANHR